MSDMYEMFWVILAIIGIVAVCKVTYQVRLAHRTRLALWSIMRIIRTV